MGKRASKKTRRKRMPKIQLLAVALIVGAIGTYALIHSFADSPAGLIFNGDFETPVASGQISPWGSVPQALNFNGQSTCVAHWPGDFYFDNGSSTSPTPGGLFTAGSSALVPPGAGAYSGRLVLPTTPAPLASCPAGSPSVHLRTNTTLIGPATAAPGDLGTDKYYGMMVYVPAGETLHNSDFSGDNLWEFHFNAVWGAPISWQLHTGGTSGVNGTADSVVLSLETGSCNNSQTASPGCDYRSNAGHAPCGIAGVNCLPGYFVIPPGQLQYGVWNEIVMHVHWASDTSGSVQTWYKTKSASTWNAGAAVSGIPTVQWDRAKGCCGFPTHEDAEQYTNAVTAPFSVNIDNQVIGTSLASVEDVMPGPSPPPPPPPPPANKKGDVTGPNGTPDGVIDLIDISYLIRKYNTNDSSADITGPNGNPDGTVDIFDLSYDIRNYGQ